MPPLPRRTRNTATRKPTPRKSKTEATAVASTLGTMSTAMMWHPSDMKRVHAIDLLKRIRRWAYRFITLNAQTCAAVKPRFFIIGNKDTVQKCHWLNPSPLDRRTKHYLRGDAKLRIGSVAQKRLAGNIDDLTEVNAHPAMDVFDNVNEWEEGYGYRQGVYFDLDAFGRHYTNILAPGPTAPPEGFWPLLAHLVKVVPHPTEFITHFEYGRGSQKVNFKREDVHWIKNYDPDDPWGGMGPLEMWLDSADADLIAVAFQAWQLNRGGTPDVLLTVKSSTEAQRKALRADWRRMFGNMGNRQESLAILEGEGGDVKQLSNSPRDMEYVKMREVLRDELGAAFGVPKSMYTTDDVNRANAEASNPGHMTNTCWPRIQKVEDSWNQRLLPRWSDRLVIIHENPLREDQAIVIQQRESRLKSGWSVNENRLIEGEEPLTDPMADKPLIATGLVPLENITEAGLPIAPPDPMGGGGDTDEPDAPTGNTDDAEPSDAGKASAHSVNPDPVGVLTKTVADLIGIVGTLVASHARTDGNNRGDHLNQGDASIPAGAKAGRQGEGAKPDLIADAAADGLDRAGGDDPLRCGCDHHDADSCGQLADCAKAWASDGDWNAYALKALGKDADAFAAKTEKELRDAINVLLASLERRAVPGLSLTPIVNQALVDAFTVEYVETVRRAIRPYVQTSVQAGGVDALAKLQAQLPGSVEIGFDVFNPRVQEFIDQYTVRLSNGIAGTTQAQAADILGKGLEAGENVQQLIQRVKDWAGEVGDVQRGLGYRAENIARTESARAYMQGELQGWKESGVVESKVWMLAAGACPVCIEIDRQFNGKALGLDEKFYNLGDRIEYKDGDATKVYKVDYEDIIAPPAHPQCRCNLKSVLRKDVA